MTDDEKQRLSELLSDLDTVAEEQTEVIRMRESIVKTVFENFQPDARYNILCTFSIARSDLLVRAH